MRKFRARSLLAIMIGLSWSGYLHAQESVNASGGDATGTGGSSAFSIGQVAYTTNNGSAGSIAQGVQHAYEIFVVGIKDADLVISLTAYANPTRDYLTLHVRDYDNEYLAYQL